MEISIRAAIKSDIDCITRIYNLIHLQENTGKATIGWDVNSYPVRETAENALKTNTLFVMTLDGSIVASAIINHQQLEAYALVNWKYQAIPERVGVLHTLVVNPSFNNLGLGRRFVNFFETYCKDNGCMVVRLDTQEKNIRAMNFYPKLGYELAGICETSTFFGSIKNIRLALFEKKL